MRSRNLVLSAATTREQALIEPHLEPRDYRRNQTLFSAGTRIARAVFPETCIVSLIIELPDGRAVESAAIGYEGVAGVGGALAGEHSFTTQRVLLAGTGHAISAAALEELHAACPRFAAALSGFRDAFAAQVLQSVACLATHQTEERLARCLLETLDRSSTSEIPFTHDMLALMIGVTRPTITLTLRSFEMTCIIAAKRGRLRILDRASLEQITCPCYGLVREAYERVGLLANGMGRMT